MSKTNWIFTLTLCLIANVSLLAVGIVNFLSITAVVAAAFALGLKVNSND